jgi:hypothetical protein
MRGGEIISSPDHVRWQVRRRWLEGTSLLDAHPRKLVVYAVLAPFVVLLFPLFGTALALIALASPLLKALSTKFVLGRPWILEAIPIDPALGEGRTFAVKGWRRSGKALAELRWRVAEGGPPENLPQEERLAAGPTGT